MGECSQLLVDGCCGTINFVNEDTLHDGAPYVRVSDRVDVGRLARFIKDDWQLGSPSLIISVTGGAKSFEMETEDLLNLKAGLYEIATTQGVWMVTGGSDDGIMKLCADAVRDHLLSSGDTDKQFMMLGVATWGAIKGFDQLIPPKSQRNQDCPFTAEYKVPDGATGLNHDHTHFVFVDDGSVGKWGVEQETRAKLELELCKSTSESGEPVPIVCLMVEGGPGTIETVRQSLIAGTPCTVVNGTGRAANALAAAYFDKVNNPDISQEQLRQKTEVHLAANGLKMDPMQIIECLQLSHLIRVFEIHEDFDSTECDLDKAILLTLLETGKLKFSQQLCLAFQWDRPDLLPTIFSAKLDPANQGVVDGLFIKAVIEDNLEFVQYLLEKKRVNMDNVLTQSVLEEIYEATRKDAENLSFLGVALHACKHKKGLSVLDRIMNSFDELTNWRYRPIYINDFQQKVRKAMRSPRVTPGRKVLKTVMDNGQAQPAEFFQCPERELFVHALVFARSDMSQFFWSRMPNQIAASLFAVRLANQMLEFGQIKVDAENKQQLEEIRETYQSHAIGVLGECNATNQELAEKVLSNSYPEFRLQSCFELAQRSDNKEFIAQSACQRVMENYWKGAISIYEPYWKILLAVLCPLLVITVEFNPKRSGDGVKAQKWTTREKFDRFYNADATRFIMYLIMNLTYIVLFAILVLGGIDESPGVLEYIIIFWTGTLLIEEIRQFVLIPETRIFRKMQSYFVLSAWSSLDIFCLASFAIGLVVRLIWIEDENGLKVGGLFYIITLSGYIIRLTANFALHDNLGPLTAMIEKMLTDLKFFLIITLVYLLAYGIAIQALMYPGETQPLMSVVWGLLFRPFFEMIGDLNRGEIGASSSSKCSVNSGLPYPYESCPEDGWKTIVAVVAQVIYILISNVLLLNILIAIFNNRFVEVHESSQIYWKYQRYVLAREFDNRPSLPPPFYIINHIYYLLRAITTRKLDQWKFIDANYLGKMLRQVREWEMMKAREYLRKAKAANQDNVAARVKRVERQMSTNQRLMHETVHHLRSLKATPALENRTPQPARVPDRDDYEKAAKEQQLIADRLSRIEQALTLLANQQRVFTGDIGEQR